MSIFTTTWLIAFPIFIFGFVALAILARLKANQEKARAALIPVFIPKE